MTVAEFTNESVTVIEPEKLRPLAKLALSSPSRRYRLCLHHTTSAIVQESVLALCRDSYIQPHRHTSQKSESYHIIEGRLAVVFFDESGNITQHIEMSAPTEGGAFLYRLSEQRWHMPVPLTDLVIMHEVFAGPFEKTKDVQYAPWAPTADNMNAAAQYTQDLLANLL